MKLSPASMTLYQLKNAIEYYRKHISEMETMYGKHRLELSIDKIRALNSPSLMTTKKRYSNYVSGLKVHEFQLLIPTDELTHKVKSVGIKEQKRMNKEVVGRWDNLLALPFNEEKFNDLVKMSRQFIQNYNEL